MAETGTTSIEIAKHLTEVNAPEAFSRQSRVHGLLEVVEAIILAMVAITTAWSGYQAARWDSVQAELYGRSSKLRVEAQSLEVQANQEKFYDANNVAEWVKSTAQGQTKLASFFERRMLPEFRPAFEAWKKTDPLHNPKAPPGAIWMPEYRNSKTEEAAQKSGDSNELFAQGTSAREHADEYVRVTVSLATVLLLTAISQRFHSHHIRIALVMIAFLMLCVPLWQLLTLPRM